MLKFCAVYSGYQYSAYVKCHIGYIRIPNEKITRCNEISGPICFAQYIQVNRPVGFSNSVLKSHQPRQPKNLNMTMSFFDIN